MISGLGLHTNPRIVITGATGRVGSFLCRELADHFDVVAVSFEQSIPENWAPFRIKLDLRDRDMTAAMLDNMKPAALIHTAALSDPNTCEKHKEQSLILNVEVTKYLASICAERGTGFSFISTDLVFDGTRGNYSETDQVNPINVYGEHKALAEDLVQEVHPSPVIFRLPWMFGKQLLGKSSIDEWLEQLQQGSPLLGFTDEYRSAVSFEVAARGIAQLVIHHENLSELNSQPDRPEIYHMGGIETVSRYYLLQQLTRLKGIPGDLIHGKKQKEAIMPAKRPSDVSLDSRKARQTGYKTPFLENMLRSSLNGRA